MQDRMTVHLIALGANSRESRTANARNVARAGQALRARFGTATKLSSLYATPAWPPSSGPDFVNAAAYLRADISATQMLAALHQIEGRFGRVRGVRWGVRSLDLDLLASGQRVLPDVATSSYWRALPPNRQRVDAPETLILPHPRLQDRGFVLIPLSEVAPQWRHPLTGRSVAAMNVALPARARAGIRRLGPI
ncbi:MAG: 2-amino-4-hydroxy-6-hydroxymethyldihydropteridine diphosphokinase [Pseudomonadota bacterium]